MDIQKEGVIVVKNEGKVVAIVYPDLVKKCQVFYACDNMGTDEVEELLKLILKNEETTF